MKYSKEYEIGNKIKANAIQAYQIQVSQFMDTDIGFFQN